MESVAHKDMKKLLAGEDFKKVCICRSIKGGTILTAIADGALSFEALRRKIRVGTGNCKAKRCRANIEGMVNEFKKKQNIAEEAHATK